jgi:hypothetical protein
MYGNLIMKLVHKGRYRLNKLSRLALVGVLSVVLCSCKGEKTATNPVPEKQAPAAQAPAASPAQNETNAKVVPFSEVFTANADGSVSPKVQLEVNGTTLAAGSTCTKGTLYGGMDVAALNGKKLLTTHKGSLLVLKGAMQ